MTHAEALTKARRLARRTGSDHYVVIEELGDFDWPTEYDTADDYQLLTYHHGAAVVTVVTPDEEYAV